MEATPKPYKIGLALSGGGAKGFAHLGVFKLLEESGLKPDIISGTSAGSLMGVLFADGYSADEITDSQVRFIQLRPFSGIPKTAPAEQANRGFANSDSYCSHRPGSRMQP